MIIVFSNWSNLETLIRVCKELEITLNESERNLIFEIIKAVCKALKNKN